MEKFERVVKACEFSLQDSPKLLINTLSFYFNSQTFFLFYTVSYACTFVCFKLKREKEKRSCGVVVVLIATFATADGTSFMPVNDA